MEWKRYAPTVRGTCTSVGCGLPAWARTLCRKHYDQWRYQQPGPLRPFMKQRFWSYVKKTRGCWEWTGARDKAGYGTFRLPDRSVRAHRFAYELLVGPIPPRRHLHHLCENPGCVKPSHLTPLTPQKHAGLRAEKTHCRRGHEFTPENTGHQPTGRYCKRCEAIKQQRYRKARRASAPGRATPTTYDGSRV